MSARHLWVEWLVRNCHAVLYGGYILAVHWSVIAMQWQLSIALTDSLIKFSVACERETGQGFIISIINIIIYLFIYFYYYLFKCNKTLQPWGVNVLHRIIPKIEAAFPQRIAKLCDCLRNSPFRWWTETSRKRFPDFLKHFSVSLLMCPRVSVATAMKRCPSGRPACLLQHLSMAACSTTQRALVALLSM